MNEIVFSINDAGDDYDQWYVLDERPTGLVILETIDHSMHAKKAFRNDLFRFRNGRILPLDPHTDASKFRLPDNAPKRRRVPLAPRSINTYPAESRLTDDHKITVNQEFARLASITRKGHVVFLDAATMATTIALLHAGVKYKRLICPQMDDDEHKLMKHWHHVRKGRLGDVLHMTTDKIAALFADYCCTWNDETRRDMALAARVVSHTIFVTLSTRGSTVDERLKLTSTVDKVLGYEWALIFGPIVYSNVVTLGFRRNEMSLQ